MGAPTKSPACREGCTEKALTEFDRPPGSRWDGGVRLREGKEREIRMRIKSFAALEEGRHKLLVVFYSNLPANRCLCVPARVAVEAHRCLCFHLAPSRTSSRELSDADSVAVVFS